MSNWSRHSTRYEAGTGEVAAVTPHEALLVEEEAEEVPEVQVPMLDDPHSSASIVI